MMVGVVETAKVWLCVVSLPEAQDSDAIHRCDGEEFACGFSIWHVGDVDGVFELSYSRLIAVIFGVNAR